jgi:hypothetical protein
MNTCPRRRVSALRLGLLAALTGLRLVACSTPVCQYALENWPADAYDLLIASNGPLAATLKADCERVLGGTGPAAANAALRFLEDPALPASEVRLTVRFPDHPTDRPPLWTGALSPPRLQGIVDSPVRVRLAAELLRGAAAVFLFLPAGDAVADTAARARLQTALDEMSRTLVLPPDPDTPAEDAAPAAPFRFPILEVLRADPAEEFLRTMLLASEADLEGLREPMAFPVFGRGRALYAIVGAGINRDVLAEACVFLTGACSCQVKAQNPGVDLLLRADWESVAGSSATSVTELPPLTGLTASESTPDALPAPAPSPAAALATPPGGEARPLFTRRALALTVAGVVIAVLAGTLILLATTRSR